MAASGLLYVVGFENLTVTNAVQDIWEFVAAAGVSILIHSVRFTVSPTITSGVAQDVRIRLQMQQRSTTGSGGTGQTPRAVNRRNTVAAATTCNSGVTTPGTAGNAWGSDLVSIIVPYERIFTPDQRIPISGGSRWNLTLVAAPGASYSASSEVYFEEI
jgi:hypothetical protein